MDDWVVSTLVADTYEGLLTRLDAGPPVQVRYKPATADILGSSYRSAFGLFDLDIVAYLVLDGPSVKD